MSANTGRRARGGNLFFAEKGFLPDIYIRATAFTFLESNGKIKE